MSNPSAEALERSERFGPTRLCLRVTLITSLHYHDGMERRQLKTGIGLAMVALGLVQTSLYVVRSEWVPIVLGLLYSVIGIAYLRVEVSAVDR